MIHSKQQKNKPSWWLRLWHQLVPRTPDFYGLLEIQADNLSETVAVLTDYFQRGDSKLADRVNALVEKGHGLRDETLRELYSSFITPIDREDIYTLSMSIDHILDYLKNTVREVEVLQVDPDEWVLRMTAELSEGVSTLSLGLARFRSGQAETVAHTVKTREAERKIEDLYRDALDTMFHGKEYQLLIGEAQTPDIRECLAFVVTRIKRREVYRHLSNAADRLAHAGEALRDISIKYDSGSK